MRSKSRLHDRESFFKYVPAKTAISILLNKTLRWSSPLLFNDPFDVPRDLLKGIDIKQIQMSFANIFGSMISNPPDSTDDLTEKLRLIIDRIKFGIPQGVKEQLVAALKDENLASGVAGPATAYFHDAWLSWLPDMRILCFTESPDHLAMWYHYADEYRGAVLEFRCIDKLDSAWLAAEQVSYPNEKPWIYRAEGWAKLLIHETDIACHQLMRIATLTKAPDWSYEKEWRMVTFKGKGEDGLFSDYPYNPVELKSVFLGPLIAPEDAKRIQTISSLYPSIETFSMEIGPARELIRHPIPPNCPGLPV